MARSSCPALPISASAERARTRRDALARSHRGDRVLDRRAGTGLAHRVQRDRAQRPVQVVAQGQPGQRVPAVAAFQGAHRRQREIDAQVLRHRVVQLGDVARLARLAVVLGQLRPARRRRAARRSTSATAASGPHSGASPAPASAAVDSATTSRSSPRSSSGHLRRCSSRTGSANRVDRGADGERLRPVGEEPARRAVEQAPGVEHDRVGHAPSGWRGRAARAHSAGRSNTAVVTAKARTASVGGGRELLAEAERVGHAGTVDHLVDQQRRHDLAPQRVRRRSRSGSARASRRGKYSGSRDANAAASGRSVASTCRGEVELGVGEQRRQLRAAQTQPRRLQRGEAGLVGQHLQLPDEPAAAPRGRR